MSANAEQIEYWNRLGEKWAAMQERIDLAMNEITDAALAFACPAPGERMLDIGCGCGTTTLRLAMIAGRDGAAAGVDVSAPMLAVAEARAQAMLADVPFIEADAATHDFQPNFDLVFSRFGVMFFADPVAAFANIRNALARTGRLAVVCWRSFPENLWAAAPYAAAKDLLPPQPPADPHAPGPFAFADGDRVRAILQQAGFRDIRIEKLDSTMNMGATAEAAAAQALEIGPLARAIADADDALREKVRQRAQDAMAPYAGPRGVTPPAACWLVGAGV